MDILKYKTNYSKKQYYRKFSEIFRKFLAHLHISKYNKRNVTAVGTISIEIFSIETISIETISIETISMETFPDQIKVVGS